MSARKTQNTLAQASQLLSGLKTVMNTAESLRKGGNGSVKGRKKQGRRGKNGQGQIVKALTGQSLRRALAFGGNTDVLERYVNCVANPFEHSPVRLGWGCAINTQLVTLWARTTVVPSGGYAAAYQLASVGIGSAYTWATSIPGTVSSALSTALTNIVPGNAGLASDISSTARVVASGIRVFPLAPMTSVQPVVYAGVTYADTISTLGAYTPLQLQTDFQTDVIAGNNRNGVMVTSRPVDPISYSFTTTTVTPGGPGFIMDNTTPYCLVAGGATDPIFFEFIMHIEQANAAAQGGGNVNIGSPNYEPQSFRETLASVLDTPEKAIHAINELVGPSVSLVERNLFNTTRLTGSNPAALSSLGGTGWVSV